MNFHCKTDLLIKIMRYYSFRRFLKLIVELMINCYYSGMYQQINRMHRYNRLLDEKLSILIDKLDFRKIDYAISIFEG